MSVQFQSRPDLARNDVGLVKASTWDVSTPERMRRTVEAVREAWDSRDWPHPGLLSYTVHAGEDGKTLFHYSQWSGEQAYQDFFRNGRDERNADIDAAVPGIRRLGLHTLELYRSAFRPEGDGGEPGCVVIVDVEFDGADKARQRDWVDTVFEALGTDPALPPGGISAHFHVSTDGTRVLNYAEWESAGAHVAALAAPGAGIGSATPQWERVQTYPGVTGGGVHRYTPALSIRPSAGAQHR
ncbi:antibiotic biosynthesis monooxygenase [Streptomyces sp. NBC_01005]|uniref:antibiotic biosynthesis monooxygenase n=1 Tax=unclassified Streptomyces TaxID=2593676 RepID=UPI002E2ECA14|nr:antibiotic biosynthesis monooxygenase [Streptomyces sp. NBC_01362]WSW08557.1 antibiotic biosynthesis monooxygenase [Streptomyces sp. NBC_01005]WTC98064.1 antibiotic biosynthesis monooxygenase [Streptomyces sp. NBC_01650]